MKRAYSYIRFSTPDQLKGDSLRRQLESSRAYAEQHGLLLDDSLRDIGVSAFKGKNKEEGALGSFLDLVNAGSIEKGSILIVESLDRISRETVSDALTQFISILKSDIEIVTLVDNQHYTRKSIDDIGSLVISLVIMSRAHEESATKSKRSIASWEQKRKLAAEQKKPMSSHCPKWLQLSDDRTKYEVIEAHAKTVLWIFQQSIAGVGRRKIAETLNQQGAKPWGRAKMWHTSFIAKVLCNKAVIGEMQPCSKEAYAPVGDPISDFYPAIIDEKTFYLAQASQKSRKTYKGGGQRGHTFTNLFTGMCKCLECEGTYRFLGRGSYAKLICDNHYMGTGCSNASRWRYDDVESAALIILAEQIDWFSALGGNISDKDKLESELRSFNGKLADSDNLLNRYRKLFEASEGEQFNDAMASYVKVMRESKAIKESIKTKESELKAFTPAQASVEMLKKAFYALVKEDDPVRVFELRAQINSTLKHAELLLYFNQDGVFFYVRSTKQKGALLSAEHAEAEGIYAELIRTRVAIQKAAEEAEVINQ